MKGVLGKVKLLCIGFVLVPLVAAADSFKWLQQMGNNGYGDIQEIYAYDGALYGVGRTDCTVNDCVGLIVKFSGDGELLWRQDFNVLETTEAFDLTVSDEGVFVVGRTAGGTPKLSRAFVVQYSLDGAVGWQHINTVDSHEAWRITHDASGVYVTGAYPYDDNIQLLTHFDFQGNTAWVKEMSSVGVADILAADEKVFVALGTSMQVYDASGSLLDEFQTPAFSNFVYEEGFLYCHNSDSIFKLDASGNLVWEQAFFNKVARTDVRDIALGKNGIWVVGETDTYPDPGLTNGIRWAEYNLKGQIKSESYLPANAPPLTYAIAFSDGDVYIGGVDFDEGVGFMAQTSALDLLKGRVGALGDADQDGYQDLAVLANDAASGQVKAYVKSSGTVNGLDNTVQFSAALRPVDFAIVPDLNANLGPELAVLSAYDASVEVRDSLTGELTSLVNFDANFVPQKLRVVADESGNGVPELAVLGVHESESRVQVEIRDSLTSAVVSRVAFNPNFIAKDFILLQDSNNDALNDVALLGINPADNQNKLEVRTTNGSLVKNVWLGKNYDSLQLIPLPSTFDGDTPASSQVAVLQEKASGAGVRIAIADPTVGTVVRTIGFNENFAPITAKAIADVNNNGEPELAVFGEDPDSGNIKVEIRDSLTGELINNLWGWQSLIPLDIAVLPDTNGNGSSEIGLLGSEVFDFDPDNFDFTVLVKDSQTAEQIDQINLFF